MQVLRSTSNDNVAIVEQISWNAILVRQLSITGPSRNYLVLWWPDMVLDSGNLPGNVNLTTIDSNR